MPKENYILTVTNEIFTVDRKYNPNSGYERDVILSPNIILVNTEIIHAKESISGKGLIKRWNFKSTKKGKSNIIFRKYKTWEKYDTEIINIETVSRKEMIQLTLHLDNEIVGYTFNGKLYDTKGKIKNNLPNIKKSIHIKIKDEDNVSGLYFYYLNGELVYSVKHDYVIYDGLFCISNIKGEQIGCPSGGLTGGGDGKLKDFNKVKIDLGEIDFPKGKNLN